MSRTIRKIDLKISRVRAVRPSMEAVGIDAYKLATSVGWDIYPIESDCDPRDIPKGSLMGLVLIY